MKFRILLILWSVFGTLGATELQVIYTCDLHGELPRFAEIAPHIRTARVDALRIDGGDLVSGNCLAEYCAGLSMLGALNLLHYDVWVPGNHEFELGYASFLRLTREFKGAVLGADWHWRQIRPRPWQIFERRGVRIAVIGLGDPKMPRRLLPEVQAEFISPYVAIEKALKALRHKRPEIIILVWHHGVYYPPFLGKILRRFPEIDLALAAHTHQEIPGKRYGHSFVVQAGSHARTVADIRINFDDRRRRVVEITSRLLRPQVDAPDPELQRWLKQCARPWRNKLYRKLSGLPQPLRRPLPGEFNFPVGNWCAARLQKYTSHGGAVLLLPNGHSERALPPTLKSFHHLLPYRNMLYTVKLRRREVIALVNWVEKAGKKMNQTPFYAGITVRRDRKGRVRELSVPPEIEVALNNYLLVSVPEFQGLFKEYPRRYRAWELVEREAILNCRRLE